MILDVYKRQGLCNSTMWIPTTTKLSYMQNVQVNRNLIFLKQKHISWRCGTGCQRLPTLAGNFVYNSVNHNDSFKSMDCTSVKKTPKELWVQIFPVLKQNLNHNSEMFYIPEKKNIGRAETNQILLPIYRHFKAYWYAYYSEALLDPVVDLVVVHSCHPI